MYTATQMKVISRVFLAISLLDDMGKRSDSKQVRAIMTGVLYDSEYAAMAEELSKKFTHDLNVMHRQVFDQLLSYKRKKGLFKGFGFSPLRLGLTGAECQVILYSIIDGEIWNGIVPLVSAEATEGKNSKVNNKSAPSRKKAKAGSRRGECGADCTKHTK